MMTIPPKYTEKIMQMVLFCLSDKPGMINVFSGQLTSDRALSD